MLNRLAALFAACTCVLAPEAAHAHPQTSLCGVQFKHRSELNAKLRKGNAEFSAGRDVTSAFTQSATALTLWWITNPTSSAFPAIACSQKEVEPDKGFVLKRAESACRGASLAACRRLEADIHRAKF
jgi:hypothetical protein